MIVHITTRAMWEQARADGAYRGDTLESEGFIHCSTPSQVLATASRFFRGRDDLVLLAIDPARVRAEIRYEGAPDGQQFPHVYGPLNLDAVTRVVDFPAGPAGDFVLPAGF